jgi:hypothetical protein
MDTTLAQRNVIYALSCLCHPEDGVRYIGKTVGEARVRLNAHRSDAKRLNKWPVHRWINKHGARNVAMSVIDQSSDPLALPSIERFWIAYYRECGSLLLNLTDGGEGCPGRVLSEETRAKIGNGNRGLVRTPEQLAVMSERMKGWVPSQAIREAVSLAHKGKPKSAEVRMKMSLSSRTITEVQAREIVERLHRKESATAIAKDMGVSRNIVNNIKYGNAWKNLERPWA